jgi:hypothetical protein
VLTVQGVSCQHVTGACRLPTALSAERKGLTVDDFRMGRSVNDHIRCYQSMPPCCTGRPARVRAVGACSGRWRLHQSSGTFTGPRV